MEENHIVARPSLTTKDYQQLLTLRTGLRRFLRWSEEQAHAAGLTPSHHQLLLAVRGHEDPRGPTIGDIAGYLLLRHHSAVELAQRAEGLGLIQRVADPDDGRVVRLVLTDAGNSALEQLSALHVEELARLADDLRPVWDGLETIDNDAR
jgi:DNA-binding MarR family transcriptional regulator